ncbi:glycoside hydrolase family 88 protein [Paenibacillus allorhizosphaerae]|uniref:Unsaturated chondroitin disaccharide hydrolase n=1 Tax=Paenibacillus allorhizosphaerae TaxID=2849866 RepID=A0ABM8VGG3_9BACL|nr:glycoside hydrolase family 88 protein [Paenibacillus allorhizosphaerae]CAG7636195.1 Unsaturated chondroitin disaccharide hydrolase [Paenibacillus allorhizosphaerae]
MNQAYIDNVMQRLQTKVDRMIEQIGAKCPHVAKEDGQYDDTPSHAWTSGFWPGLLWIMHDVTGKPHYRDAAWSWDENIEQWLAGPLVGPGQGLHHDVGFQFLPTAVIKHTLTGDEDGLRRGLQAANFLAGRFNPAGSFIRAWNRDHIGWAIVDCMMNLSILFWASESSRDPRFKHIAVAHANTALRHFVRPDGSTNHIVVFDPETGEAVESLGGQGYGPHSAWSRGASWAIYGFANTYRYTADQRYLEAAKRVAHFFLASLPDDHVPHWDFRTETLEGEPRDSSAAAIAASGLLEIADHVPEAEARFYTQSAKKMLHSLTERYATWDRPEHEAILLHGTGNKPSEMNIDVSLIYGDYYYVESFAKLSGWKHRIF